MNERENEGQEKTEEPTDEKRKQFREEGNVASPREVVHSFSLLVFVGLLYFAGDKLQEVIAVIFNRCWLSLKPFKEPNEFIERISTGVAPVIPLFIGLGIVVTIAPTVLGLCFTKFNWSNKKMSPKFSKMNPITGITRVFGFQMFPELIKSIAKFLALGAISYAIIGTTITDSAGYVTWDPRLSLAQTGRTALMLLFAISIAGLVIGLGDWAFNLWRTDQKMRMSKQEVKDDLKKQEGDPLIRGQRRRMAREFIFQRSLQNVPNATFVVTNPTHYSVAIRYAAGMSAPIVVAKGVDFLAFRIREIAQKHEIALVENKALARTLYKMVEIGDEVPASLYSAVIEIMKYIIQTRGRTYFERFDVLHTRRANA